MFPLTSFGFKASWGFLLNVVVRNVEASLFCASFSCFQASQVFSVGVFLVSRCFLFAFLA